MKKTGVANLMICNQCKKTVSKSNEFGVSGVISAKDLHFCSEKCSKKYARINANSIVIGSLLERYKKRLEEKIKDYEGITNWDKSKEAKKEAFRSKINQIKERIKKVDLWLESIKKEEQKIGKDSKGNVTKLILTAIGTSGGAGAGAIAGAGTGAVAGGAIFGGTAAILSGIIGGGIGIVTGATTGAAIVAGLAPFTYGGSLFFLPLALGVGGAMGGATGAVSGAAIFGVGWGIIGAGAGGLAGGVIGAGGGAIAGGITGIGLGAVINSLTKSLGIPESQISIEFTKLLEGYEEILIQSTKDCQEIVKYQSFRISDTQKEEFQARIQKNEIEVKKLESYGIIIRQ